MKKKVKVVMLPTEKASELSISKDDVLYKHDHLSTRNDGSVNQHLYLVSDEEIKDGDHFMSAFYGYPLHNTQEWRDKQKELLGEYPDLTDLKQHKIIATTDKSLLQRVKNPEGFDYKYRELELPQIPESFIKAYVEANGEIDEVMVEYEDYEECHNYNGQHLNKDCSCKGGDFRRLLKTREDNTVIIHRAESPAKKEIIDFATWYSGMEREKVASAYTRYLKEVNHG